MTNKKTEPRPLLLCTAIPREKAEKFLAHFDGKAVNTTEVVNGWIDKFLEEHGDIPTENAA